MGAISKKLASRFHKAKRQLGWEPRVKFKELVKIMVDADLKLAEAELHMSKMTP